MPPIPSRAFAITSSTAETLQVGGSGEVTFTFTVTNALGRPVRARAIPEPEGDTPRGQLQVIGEAEREFAADGTHTISVVARVPPGTRGGTYPFHLLVATVSNPDEEYAHGPAVSYRVDDTPPPRPFPWWIVAAVAGAVVIGLVVTLVVLLQKPGLGQPCDDGACSGELVCKDRDGAALCLVAVAAECSADDDCVSRNCEGEAAGRKGTCGASLPGAPCDDGKCPENQQCSGGTCLADNGQACQEGDTCLSGVCRDSQCAEPIVGGACGAGDTCPENATCDDGLCKGKLGFLGCTLGSDCETGVCEEARKACVHAIGLDCTTNANCPEGQECKVKSGVGSCLVSSGLQCAKNADCATGWCNTLASVPVCASLNQSCTKASQCASGYQCTNGRCGLPDGASCMEDAVCTNNWCSSGKCTACTARCSKSQYCYHNECKNLYYVTDVYESYVVDLADVTSATTYYATYATATTSRSVDPAARRLDVAAPGESR